MKDVLSLCQNYQPTLSVFFDIIFVLLTRPCQKMKRSRIKNESDQIFNIFAPNILNQINIDSHNMIDLRILLLVVLRLLKTMIYLSVWLLLLKIYVW